MSLDEAALVLDIIDRGWVELLLEPLARAQVAPAGFLLLEKASVAVAGEIELAFRFFPFLLSILGLFLFWRLARRYLRFATMLSALIVFALSPSATLYAGTAKQYSGDIAITLVFVLITGSILDGTVGRAQAFVIGVAGGALLLISHPAVLISAGCGAYLVVDALAKRRPIRPVLIVCAGWSLGATVATWISLRTLSASTSAHMHTWWENSFVPPPWTGLGELLWIPSRLGSSLTWFATGLIPPPRSLPQIGVFGLYTLLLPVGFICMMRKDFRKGLLLAVPVIVALGASVARLLPLGGRVSLYLYPFLLVWCFAGLEQIPSWMFDRLRGPLYGTALALVVLPTLVAVAKRPPPRVLGSTGAVLEELRNHWHPGDRLVANGSPLTYERMEFYARRLGLLGWVHLERLEGPYRAEEVMRGYLRQIDAFRGAPRVWFHLEGTKKSCEVEAIRGYLSAIGLRRYSVRAYSMWGDEDIANLYDLSDPTRLEQASADEYALPECVILLDRQGEAGTERVIAAAGHWRSGVSQRVSWVDAAAPR